MHARCSATTQSKPHKQGPEGKGEAGKASTGNSSNSRRKEQTRGGKTAGRKEGKDREVGMRGETNEASSTGRAQGIAKRQQRAHLKLGWFLRGGLIV